MPVSRYPIYLIILLCMRRHFANDPTRMTYKINLPRNFMIKFCLADLFRCLDAAGFCSYQTAIKNLVVKLRLPAIIPSSGTRGRTGKVFFSLITLLIYSRRFSIAHDLDTRRIPLHENPPRRAARFRPRISKKRI